MATGDKLVNLDSLKAVYDNTELSLDFDATDGLLYIYKNGIKAGTGVEVSSSVVRYSVSYTMPHVSSTNAATQIVEGKTFSTTLTADEGYEIRSVTVTMNGATVENAYDSTTGIVTVPNVTGNLELVVVSKALVVFNEVTWLDTAYGIGDNSIAAYNGWAPGCAKYDETLAKVIFLQCHASKHSGVYSPSELWAIDPYNVMDSPTKLGEFAVAKGIPLAFDIYNGVYYVVSTKTVYVSSDHGATWIEHAIVTAPTHAYGLKIIDDVMYLGDDGDAATAGTYYTSTDWGLNWQANTFDFIGDYDTEDMACCEAEFVKFNGRIYASLRRGVSTGKLGILAVLDNGEWKVISEELPNVHSDCFLFATDSDVICFAAIDRPNKTLKLGTITIGENDAATVTVNKSVAFTGTGAGDFHTPTYVIGSDFHMVTLVCGLINNEYLGAGNIALVGYTDLARNRNPSFTTETFTWSNSHVTAEPYSGTVTLDANGNVETTNGTIVNLSRRYANTFPPDEEGNVYSYAVNTSEVFTNGNLNRPRYDMVEYNSKKYVARIAGVKLMYPALKVVRGNINTLGVTPSGGVFDYATTTNGWNTNRRENLFLKLYNWNATLVKPENVGTL